MKNSLFPTLSLFKFSPLVFFLLSCGSSKDSRVSSSWQVAPELTKELNKKVAAQSKEKQSPAQPTADENIVEDALNDDSDEGVEKQISMSFKPQKKSRSGMLKIEGLSLNQVSRDLGIPRGRLEENTRHLALFLSGYKGLAQRCQSEEENTKSRRMSFRPDPKLCELITDLQNSENGSKKAYAPKERRVPVRPQHFSLQQKMRFARLLSSLEKEPASRILAWVPLMTKTQGCPRNLSAAALRRVETLLPSNQAQNAMEKLYEHANHCLQPSDDAYEITHFRQALLRRVWNKNDLARKAINRALLGTESSEKSRVLYWAGLMQTNTTLQQSIWDRLVEEYPLSYHALEVWRHRKQDPLKVYSNRESFDLSRQALEKDANQAIRWLETLYIFGHVDAAQRLTRWMTRTYQQKLSKSNLVYVSLLKSSKGTPLNTISFLTRQVSENPEILNDQTLKMLFPKPYFDIFDKASPNTDTFLVLAVARQESGFNPMARSPKNAQGLLQILPSTARMLSGKRANNLYDTQTNAKLGVKFLSRLITKFDSVEKALAGYNAGPGRIPQWENRFPTKDTLLFMDLVPFKETRNYVPAILRNNYWYARLYGDLGNRKVASEMQSSSLVDKLVLAHGGSQLKDTAL